MATRPHIQIPPHLVIVRFDAPAGDPAEHFPCRIVADDDKAKLGALIEEIKASPDNTYIVDLTGKSFCGTMRLGILLRLQQNLRATGRVLRIAVDQKELLEVFRLTRLNTIMPVSTSITEAVADALRPI